MEKRRRKQILSGGAVRRLGALGLAGGSVAGTESAEAGINYVNVNPDEVVFATTFTLDVDGAFGGDAGTELEFTNVIPGTGTNYFGNASAQANSNFAFIAGFFGAGSVDRYVSNPTSGALIAALNTAATALVPQAGFNFTVLSSGQAGLMANHAATNPNFKFMSEGEAFLSFQFRESTTSKNGFGWVRLSVSEDAGGPQDQNTITIQDYAWSIDTPISVGQVPEPSAIGMLALGAFGLSLMRRRSQNSES